ncbi:unnamed protein product [Urochloa decumbens]|uniref:Uncharacterized protein n=1 Tax=Urochloa decumbens TaxID=240449 RepID=A0ABC8Y481_9POAL
MSGRRRKAKRRKQHLYLAFDDWQSGYTIRKVRLSPGSDSGEGIFTRIWAPRARGLPRHLTSAFGTKIVALHIGGSHIGESHITGIPIIDVKDHSFFFGPHPNCPPCPIYFPIGDDRLFALDIGTFDFFFGKPDTAPWVWHELTYPPFRRHVVSSYAIQPDGCILVSTRVMLLRPRPPTSSTPRNMCGNYTVIGRCPSRVVDTIPPPWMPLSVSPVTRRPLGISTAAPWLAPALATLATYCTLPLNVSAARRRCTARTQLRGMPDEELPGADEELLEPVTDEELLEPGTYYEELLEPGTYYEEPRPAVGDRFMYRLKTFSLRYDASGDLKLEHHQVRCYSVPHETTIDFIIQDPVAFWL